MKRSTTVALLVAVSVLGGYAAYEFNTRGKIEGFAKNFYEQRLEIKPEITGLRRVAVYPALYQVTIQHEGHSYMAQIFTNGEGNYPVPENLLDKLRATATKK